MQVRSLDHYRGISNSFDKGLIYCSKATGILLSMKFQGVKDQIVNLEYNTPTEIQMNKEHNLKMTVVMMDANHIIGSVMFLFYGYFGSVLYTGDMRYHPKILSTNSYLFNPNRKLNFHIDELILDNTYCDPLFDFPAQV